MAALLDNYQQSFVALILKTQFAIRSLPGSRNLGRTQGTIVFEDVSSSYTACMPVQGAGAAA